MALLSIDKFEVFFSSCTFGSCFFRCSKQVRSCARRFFSSLLCTSRVPDRTPDGLLWLPPLEDAPLSSHHATELGKGDASKPEIYQNKNTII